MIVDVGARGVSGRKRLDAVGITVNKNTVPFDTRSPMVASGIRIGTRGIGIAEMEVVGEAVARTLDARDEAAALQGVRRTIAELCAGFPLPA
jgi:glycine hydroxymethyltransferase